MLLAYYLETQLLQSVWMNRDETIRILLHCLETVSYTHLDVYKRQVGSRIMPFYILF